MKSKRLAGAARRERRAFSAEFKAEAVRLVAERRAVGVTVAEVGRELDVRPDQLRAWTRQARHVIRCDDLKQSLARARPNYGRTCP